jgi:hypothetical protein
VSQSEKQVPPEVLDLQDTLEYLECRVKILDRVEKSTKNTASRSCKLQWSNYTEQEATWEKEVVMKEKYPHLFKPKV